MANYKHFPMRTSQCVFGLGARLNALALVSPKLRVAHIGSIRNNQIESAIKRNVAVMCGCGCGCGGRLGCTQIPDRA